MRRVLVAGVSGVGKTTVARRIADRLSLPFHEMDALYHGPNWQPLTTFVAEVDRISAGECWVLDSHGYPEVRDLVWTRADTVVWLDYSRWTAMQRVVRRSFARATYDRTLWNGNREGFRDWVDPEHPVRWAWSQYDVRRTDCANRSADPAYAHLTVARFARPRDTNVWIADLPSTKSPPGTG